MILSVKYETILGMHTEDTLMMIVAHERIWTLKIHCEYITSVVCTRYFIDTRMRTKYQDQVLIESEISAGT